MCDICKKHGDGDKWYFNPKNYSKEMEEARLEYLERLASRSLGEWMIGGYETVYRYNDVPLLGKLLKNIINFHYGKETGGQIIPLTDLLKTLDICDNPALLPCECRKIVGKEGYQCLNMGLLPELYKRANPDEYIDELSKNKAKRLITKWDKKGLYHLILWTGLPYITTVCNCTTPICTAYKGRTILGLENSMLKGEYVAYIDPQNCNGCKICLTRCQFGAVYFNLDDEKAFVDITKCFGCGLCYTGCLHNAIKLVDRKITPARNLW